MWVLIILNRTHIQYPAAAKFFFFIAFLQWIIDQKFLYSYVPG